MKLFIKKSSHFLKIIFMLIKGPQFITLSFIGNTVVMFFAMLIYFLESDVNANINSYLDALWWSFATTTTIGYGDIVPVTPMGKFIGICLMLIGVGIFSIYTALFARAILDDKEYMS